MGQLYENNFSDSYQDQKGLLQKNAALELKLQDSSNIQNTIEDQNQYDRLQNPLSIPSHQSASIDASKLTTPIYKEQNLLNDNLVNDHIIVSGNDKFLNRKRLINVCNKIAAGPSENMRPKRKVREL